MAKRLYTLVLAENQMRFWSHERLYQGALQEKRVFLLVALRNKTHCLAMPYLALRDVLIRYPCISPYTHLYIFSHLYQSQVFALGPSSYQNSPAINLTPKPGLRHYSKM